MNLVRTRFAPSPTGHLHVGGARTALFNFLQARAKKGVFLLRMEDTDQARSSQESCDQMIESMKWLGLDWDEGYQKGGEHGPYRQSERLSIYHEHIGQLLAREKAYRCFCTTQELEAKKKRREAMGLPPVYDGKCRSLSEKEISERLEKNEPHAIRFKIPDQRTIVVNDMVQGEVRFETSLIGDFIILKSDEFPSYNFSVVVDDHLMNISHVIRGVGHLSNTPRQILIFEAFGWEEPAWAHVSEIVGSDRKKLSKRHGAVNVMRFRDLGYPAEAFVNYMALLGWAPPDGVEYMTMDQLISQFDIARCSKSPAMFDVFDLTKASGVELNDVRPEEFKEYLFPKSKLNWIANQTIRDRPEPVYWEEVMPFVNRDQTPGLPLPPEAQLKETLLKLRVYLDHYSEVGEHLSGFLIQDESIFTQEAKAFLKQDFSRHLIENFIQKIQALKSFDEPTIKNAIKEAGELSGVKGKDLFMTVRSSVTGKIHGLELPTYIRLLGKDLVLKRLQIALKILEKDK